MTKSQLLPLTGLRFWLALWVIVYHQSIMTTYHFPRQIVNILRTGHIAVGMFFVLSGFILSYNYDVGNLSKTLRTRFAVARFARIYPVYFLALLSLTPFWMKAILRSPMRELALAVPQFGLLQAWTPLATGIWYWNSPGWSLSCEAFFYLLFPSLGGALWRRTSNLRRTMLMICLCWLVLMSVPLFSVLASLPGCAIAATYEQDHSFYLNLIRFDPLLRLPEFLSGVLACRLYIQLRGRWEAKGYRFYLPALAAILLVVVMAADKLPYVVLTNGLLLPVTVLFIVGLALGGGPVSRLLSSRSMVFLGGASYSMYLLHAPIRLWMLKLHVPNLSNAYGSLAYICLVIAIASAVFQYIEGPTNSMIRTALDRNRMRASRPVITAHSGPSVAADLNS